MLKELFDLVFSTAFLTAGVLYATPFILAAMGGLISERSGVINLGLEGMMLTGALFGFMGSYFTGSPTVGLLAAMGAALVLGLIHGFATVYLRANQVVSAVAVNIFALGITSAFFRAVFGTASTQLRVKGFKPMGIPFLERIPVLGKALFSQNIFIYLVIVLVPLTHFVLFKTKWGLAIRSCGENPRVAETMGVRVNRVRLIAVLYSSAIAGLAGASLSIAGINMFIENISSGRGYIAFACIILGKFSPLGTAVAALLFGFTEGLQLRIQATGVPIPYQIPLMFPYILTIVMLFVVGSKITPESWGQSFNSDAD